jgi:hypothetical protein
MQPISDLLGATEFQIGLLVGTLALLVTFPTALGLSALFPRRLKRPGLVGVVFALASLAALAGTLGTDEVYPVPAAVLLGIGLLFAAGTIAARVQPAWLVGPLAAVPGAVVLANESDGLQAEWIGVLIVVGAAVIGATAADLDKRASRWGIGPVLLVITVLGIYVTVPDTELMRTVVGVALPLVLLGVPYAAASLGAGGAFAAVGTLLWILPVDGRGRAGSIVGAAVAFGLLYGEPLGRALAAELQSRVRLDRFPVKQPRIVYVVAQLVVVAYATRVAGQAETASTALLLAIPAIAASVAFGVFCVLPVRRRRRHRPRTRRARSSASRVRPPSSNGHGQGGANGHGPRPGRRG